ncbi:MAG: DUF420 domain-containing protein [Planctomycetota bacterium]|nr:DUF420 domain-containing protein [Planctomycetota bacterium]
MSRPAIHALLNGTAALMLTLGWLAIRGKGPFARRGRDEGLHKRFMVAALFFSTCFLASYLEYHASVGSVPFWGTGWIRTIYLAVLIPHIVLATVMVPPIVILVVHAARGRLDRHKRLARWTLPVWLYVSVTGVLVYLMLYRLGPA